MEQSTGRAGGRISDHRRSGSLTMTCVEEVQMAAPTIKRAAASRIEADSAALVQLSQRIHAHPELAFAEERASLWCAEILSAAGFDVERGVRGLSTALRATAGSGSLRIAPCAEYDAPPGIGHAEFAVGP